jgi:hypothetical protein
MTLLNLSKRVRTLSMEGSSPSQVSLASAQQNPYELTMMARHRFTQLTTQFTTQLTLRASVIAIAVSAAWSVQAADTRYESPIAAPSTGSAPRVFAEGAYAANAAIARVVVEVDADGLPADGQTASKITVRLFDKNNKPLAGEALITVEVSAGRVQLVGAKTDELGPGRLDADRAVRGTQIKVVAGVVSFNLLAPSEPQDVKLRVTGGAATAEGMISFVPDLREMVAAGLIEGIIRFNKKSASSIQPVRLDDGFEQEIRRFERLFNDGKSSVAARTAMFIKGKIRGDALLTLAYDSDKETRARLLRDIRPDEFYPVYGDSSVKAFDAKSSSKLYVRVDKNKNYALFGDYATGDGFSQQFQGGTVANQRLRSLGAYNRTLTGLRTHYESGGVLLDVFAARDSLKQVTEELRSNGTSGPFSVRNSSALENSEKVEFITRFKDNPGRIKSVTALARFDDYTFEPFSGRILLNRPLPSVDEQGDPNSLRITYEVDQGGEKFWVAGLDGQFNVTPDLTIGGALIEDKNPTSPYRLSSLNAGLRIGAATSITAEVAQARSSLYEVAGATFTNPTLSAGETRIDQSGKAVRVDVRHKTDSVDVDGYIVRTDKEFYNPNAPLQQGRSEASLKAKGKLNDSISVFGEVIRSDDDKTGGERKGGALGIELKLSTSLTLTGGVRKVQENALWTGGALIGQNVSPGSSTSPTGGFFGGIDPTVINPVTGLATPTFGAIAAPQTGQGISIDATTLFLGANWQATDKIALDAMVEGSVRGDSKHRFILGGAYQLSERSRLFARAESQTGLTSAYGAARSNALTVGADTSYMPGGQLFSEYRLRDADGRSSQLATGVRNTWNVREGVIYTTAFEHLKVLDGTGGSAAAIALGFDYTADPLWKLASKLEWRRAFDAASTPTNDRSDTILSTVSLARKLDRDWTLLARNYFLRTTYGYNAGSPAVNDGYAALQNRFQIGGAYRPVDTNRFDALAKYEYKLENNVDAFGVKSRVHIASAHGNYHPSRPWWFTGRIAAKSRTDIGLSATGDAKYSAALLSGRGIYDVTENWDLGFMVSTLRGGGASQYAYGLEVGYLVRQNLWLSLGYNWRGFSDKDLTASEYTNGGLYLRLRFKFDENLFSGGDKQVNRALDRSGAAKPK